MTRKNAKLTGQALYAFALVLFFIMLLLVSVPGKAQSEPRTFRNGKLADRSIIVDYAHHEIHVGNHYVAFYNAPLGNAGNYQLLINTPATEDIHLFISTRGSVESNVVFREDTTVSNVGSAHSVINRNRQSSKTSGVEVTLAPTITGLGTVLMESHFGNGQKAGGDIREQNEFVLKRSTFYLVNATSEAASNDLSVLLDFYKDDGSAP